MQEARFHLEHWKTICTFYRFSLATAIAFDSGYILHLIYRLTDKDVRETKAEVSGQKAEGHRCATSWPPGDHLATWPPGQSLATWPSGHLASWPPAGHLATWLPDGYLATWQCDHPTIWPIDGHLATPWPPVVYISGQP